MYRIRPYNPKDADGVKDICVGLADDFWKNNPVLREALEVVFCRYYIEQEPQNCFVAVDEHDDVQGYVLCAEDYRTYSRVFSEKYMDRSENPAVKAIGQSTMEALKARSEEYPAHLHIDLYPGTQGQGVGRRLIECLVSHLKGIGVSGLMLDVAKDNTGAQIFYEKLGFIRLGEGENEITYGMRI